MPQKEIPDRYLGMIIHFLMNFHNDTSEFKHPHLRRSLQRSYIFFAPFYAALMLCGFIANLMMLRELFLQRQQRLSAYKYLACNAINDLLKCLIILPIAFSTTLFQNWIYGSFLCYFFPMMQDVPFHVTTLTFLLIVFDRYRQIIYPIKPRISSCAFLVSVWLASIFAVLPYAMYTKYLDLELYFGSQFKDTGICAINIEDNIEEYIRGLFIVMYVLPLGLIAFMHVKSSEEIKTRLSAYSVVFHETNPRETDLLTAANVRISGRPDGGQRATSSNLTVPNDPHCSLASRDETVPQSVSVRLSATTTMADDEHDWVQEKRIQNYIATVITVYAVCLLPLNLVRLLKHVIYETHENSYHFDLTFIIVVWIAFIPTVATPLLFRFSKLYGNRFTDVSSYLRLGRASDVSFAANEAQKRQAGTSRAAYNENVGAYQC